MGVCNCSMFCCTLLYAHSSFAIILMEKRELIALLSFSFWCRMIVVWLLLGRVAQSVTCLAKDACLTADPGVASSIPARSHTFVEIDHEIISTVILLPSAD